MVARGWTPKQRRLLERKYRELCEAWDVPVHLPILEWVRENFYFSGKIAAFPGFWDRDLFPYLDGILQALTDPEVEEVVLVLGTQMGKTACLCAIIAYCLVVNGTPSLIATPDEKSAMEHQREKLVPHLRMVNALKAKIKPDSKLTRKYVDLGDKIVYYAWSGAPWTVSGRSAALVAVTEVNLHSRKKSGEGDPVEMARDRTKAFAASDRKILIEGKCTVKGDCRLTNCYDESNQSTLQVPCPHCSEYQYLERGTKGDDFGLKWKFDRAGDVIPDSVYYLCRHCHGHIEPGEKLNMLRRCKWVPAGMTCSRDGLLTGIPSRSKRISGFKAGSLYSNAVGWAEYAQKFVAAKRKGLEALKNFRQSWDAEAWEYSASTIQPDDILTHCGAYKAGELPCDPLIIICGVDVQKDHLWHVVRAYGYGAESWLLSHGRLESFSARFEGERTMQALDEVLSRDYTSPGGTVHRIKLCLIDSGDGNRQQEVYDYCYKNVGVCQPIKGAHQYTHKGGVVHVTRIQNYEPMQLWSIDKGIAMDSLFDLRLNIKRGDPGYFWLPDDKTYDLRDYIRSLMSWKREPTKASFGRIVPRWVSKSAEYEHLADIESYLEAACGHLHLSHYARPETTHEQQQQIAATKRKQLAERSDPSGFTRRDGRQWWDRA